MSDRADELLRAVIALEDHRPPKGIGFPMWNERRRKLLTEVRAYLSENQPINDAGAGSNAGSAPMRPIESASASPHQPIAATPLASAIGTRGILNGPSQEGADGSAATPAWRTEWSDGMGGRFVAGSINDADGTHKDMPVETQGGSASPHQPKWPHTMDAAVWAREFCARFDITNAIVGESDGDKEGTMIGWFANAIMAGYDTAQSRAAPIQQTAQPVAQWGDPRVQIVYDILCDDVAPPNPEEHWEGFDACRIVDALYAAPSVQQTAQPVADRIRELREYAASKHPASEVPMTAGEVMELFDARSAETSLYAAAQPVAWMYDGLYRYVSLDRRSVPEKWTETPLYAAAQPIPRPTPQELELMVAAYHKYHSPLDRGSAQHIEGMYRAWMTWAADKPAQPIPRDEQRLRALLASCYAGALLYSDDGELQDCREVPFIDFKRDTIDEIDAKMTQRMHALLRDAAPKSTEP